MSSPPPPHSADEHFQIWRDSVARRLLAVMTGIAVLVVLGMATSLARTALVIAVVIVLLLAVVTISNKASHGLRVAVIMTVFAYGCAASLASDNEAAAILYVLTGLVLGALLSNWRVGLVYLLATTALLGLGAWARLTGRSIPLPDANVSEAAAVISNVGTYVGVGATLLLSLSYLLGRLRQALADQAAESAALEQANSRLIEEQTERMALERALATNARLESLGRLAGSVAHDFNNLLQGMRANVELSTELVDEPEAREMLGVTTELIERAGELTRSLLRFSRGESLDAERLDVHALLDASARIYQSVIGNGVEVEFALAAERTLVAFNPVEFEQILLNLMVNAADAMPDGGRMRVSTRNTQHAGAELLELTVADEGEGMSETLMAMIFQPYFTTKSSGSGIGLATVHDIVTRSGGDIRVESELGQGTVFRLSFPLDAAA